MSSHGSSGTPSQSAEPSSSSSRGSGTRGNSNRARSRGGLGKYLRARGRGHARGGRPAEWGKRLVLSEEETVELDPESEEVKEDARRYARRELGSNLDRYEEVEPELDSEGEVMVEPEVDLSSFLARQRLSSSPPLTLATEPLPGEDKDVDQTLAHLSSGPISHPQKGRMQRIEWDKELDEMSREKAVAEANWDLKARFRAQAEKQKQRVAPATKTSTQRRTNRKSYTEAPPLPTDPVKPPQNPKDDMEDFLDDLLG